MGLIVKTIDHQDRRLRRLYLSDKGRNLVSQIKEILFDD
jgi:DNA-binding MarR family transcriptional regulator